MKSRSGFTIIELVVCIAIIGILLAISILSYSKQQVDARDQTRFSRATIVAAALEKYYEANGEYPSVPAVVSESGTTGTTLAGKLKINTDVLTMPGTAPATTNSLSNTTPSTTKVTYVASSVDPTENTACQSSPTGGCDRFTLTYKKETDNSNVVISSKYSDRTAIATPPPPPPPSTPAAPDAPTAPTMTTSYASNIITGTSSAVSCTYGNTPQYALSTRTNDGTWSAYSGWSPNRAVGLSTAQGNKYGFQAKARCVSVGEGTSSTESAASPEVTYIQPITTPSAPSPYITSVFQPAYNNTICMDANGAGTANGTLIQIWACNGSAAQDWAYNSNDKTIRPTYAMNMCVTASGALGAQLTLGTCDGATSRQWTRGDSGFFQNVANGGCMDAASWGTANGTSIGSWNCSGATAQIWNPIDSQTAWAWPDVACPAGTTAGYQVNNQTTALADSGWISTGSSARVVRTTVNQGYTYTTQTQARCTSSYATSPWSSTSQSTIAKAVLPPPAPSGWSFWKNDANRYNMNWGWNFTLTCGAGTNRYFIEDEWINNPGNPVYWLSPRQPNGVGAVGWWTADSTSGAPYVVYGPNATMQTLASYAGAAPATAGLSVSGRAQGYCYNPVTGRSSVYGPWGQGWGNL